MILGVYPLDSWGNNCREGKGAIDDRWVSPSRSKAKPAIKAHHPKAHTSSALTGQAHSILDTRPPLNFSTRSAQPSLLFGPTPFGLSFIPIFRPSPELEGRLLHLPCGPIYTRIERIRGRYAWGRDLIPSYVRINVAGIGGPMIYVLLTRH